VGGRPNENHQRADGIHRHTIILARHAESSRGRRNVTQNRGSRASGSMARSRRTCCVPDSRVGKATNLLWTEPAVQGNCCSGKDDNTLNIEIKENNVKYTYTIMMLLSALLISSISFAGYHYGGQGCMMSTWDMTEMDSNQDNMLSLEEYSDRYRKSLSKSFNMIDINQDGMVDEGEWTTILEVHGVMTD
jgi:hypothetical protein